MTIAMCSDLVTETSALPLLGAALRCDARGGIARVVLEQRFRNDQRQPMHVIYTIPLPADAAVSGFRFHVGDRTIEGTIDRRAAARERFEDALANGQTAALLEEERSSLFTQELGNIPPGAEITCEIELDQKLAWLDEGSWEWRFPLSAAPRYLGASGRVADASAVSVLVAEDIAARASLAMHVRDEVVGGRSPESPSHPLSTVPNAGGFRVELGAGNSVALDRDVVVRWPVALDRAHTSVDAAGPRGDRLKDAHALVTLVPPRKTSLGASVARDVTLLLDTSGSMGGAPLAQAKRVALATVDSLGPRDRFEMVEFSSQPRRFRPSMTPADAVGKRAASEWIRALEAGGGTEMREGILEALRPRVEGVRDGALAEARSTRLAQVVLVTDGLIGFEQEIVREILSLLPGDARLHAVGVGSSVNRALTGPAARAGRGIEVVIGLGEDPERAVQRLLARTVAPVVTEIEAFGGALLELAPMKIPDLFAGAPVCIAARVRPEGGAILLRGKTDAGVWEERVHVPATKGDDGSDAVIALFGRESAEDVEMRLAGGLESSAADATLESLGLSYRIATRLTSWIAIDSRPGVDPRDPSRRVVVPQALPYGTSVESFGLRAGQPMFGAPPSAAAPMSLRMRSARPAPPMARSIPAPQGAARQGERAAAKGGAGEASKKKKESLFERIRDAFTGKAERASAWAATLAVVGAGEIILEIVVFEGETLEWKVAPEAEASIDGVTVRLAVDVSRTTREGTYESGTTVRLALQVPADFEVTKLYELTMNGLGVSVVRPHIAGRGA